MKITVIQNQENVNPNFEELFSQVSPEIAATFTEEQIAAIKNSFQNRQWHKHDLNVRISVPVRLIHFYLVLLAGEERRSKQRLEYEKSLNPIWTPGNILFLIIFAFIILTGGISTIFFFKSLIPKEINSAFPTSIPWVNNQNDCEKFNRTWNDNKCWDNEHSPNF